MKLDQPVHIVSASLAASSFVALTQFLAINKNNMTDSIQVSIIAFAITLPILAALAISPLPTKKSEKFKDWFFGFIILTWLISLVGIACIFLSFALSYMLLFLASSVIAVSVFASLAEK